MALVKRPNSKFWYMQFQFNGQNYVRSSRTTDKRVAAQMEDRWRAELHAQQFLGRKPRITLKAALADYCQSKVGTPNHRNLLVHQWAVLKILAGGRYVDELTSADLERVKRERQGEGIAAQTIRHSLQLVGAAIKYSKKGGFQATEVSVPEVKLPKYPLRYLTREEEDRLLAELDPRRASTGLRPYESRSDSIKREMQDAYDLVVLLLDTGARYSEIANIEWSRIDLDSQAIHLWRPKVQNETILFMTDRVHAVVRRRAAARSSSFLFSNKKGGPRGYASVAIRKAIRRAGLKGCRIHTLRHTHASRLIQNGMSVYEVREILGHTDIKTTMRYAHLEHRHVATRARDLINALSGASAPQMEGPVV